MKLEDFKNTELPDNPGVYFFKKGKNILYIGKASSLKDRVRSYFSSDLKDTRGQLIVKMIEDSSGIEYKKTNSVLEALILEAYEIKKHQPVANTKEKDNKSYNYVVITDEDYPRVLIERGRNLDSKLVTKNYKIKSVFGPFPNGGQLREAMKIVRKLFPFRDKCLPYEKTNDQKLASIYSKAKSCFNRQIGLCPGVCTGEIDIKQYKKIILNIELFFSGKIDKVKNNLEKEMRNFAKDREFEKAENIKRTLFALDHIHDVSLIKHDIPSSIGKMNDFRIEGYDIAHFSGTSTVGVMVVIENNELAKKEYRKFKIYGTNGKVSIDDTKNLKELLLRRFDHPEWKSPNLIVIDGGIAQRRVALEVLKAKRLNIDIVSVVKDEKHKAKDIMGDNNIVTKYKNEILLLNNEAHRFAIKYHNSLRNKTFIEKK